MRAEEAKTRMQEVKEGKMAENVVLGEDRMSGDDEYASFDVLKVQKTTLEDVSILRSKVKRMLGDGRVR